MSLEYSMFRFSDDYPTAEGLSEMIMQVSRVWIETESKVEVTE